MPVVQIYTMQSAAEAVAVARLGIERIGVTPAERGLPGEVSLDVAASIADAVRDSATVCALSVESDLEAVSSMVRSVRPDVLHLCAPPGSVTPADVARLRAANPGVEVMAAIAVEDESSIREAVAYAAVADSLILDSSTPDVEGVGAAGVVHDWEISERIVAAVTVPVILAGGLSPANVAEAVATVGPWGVDSLTHTNAPRSGGGFRKDLDLIAAFASAARGGLA